MAEYVPFANTAPDWMLQSRVFPNPAMIRTPLVYADKVPMDRRNKSLWIDTGLHFCNWPDGSEAVAQFHRRFDPDLRLRDPDFQKKPATDYLRQTVGQILDAGLVFNPGWLSVPMIPLSVGAGRIRMNREICSAVGYWRRDRRLKQGLILPVVVTRQEIVNKLPNCRKALELAVQCFHDSGATGIWVVESSLDDDTGSPSLGKTHFPKLLHFHSELKQRLPSGTVIIGGPYWAMNLILWARRLITFPAIGLGKGFRYYPEGGPPIFPAKNRVAIKPLRRLAVASSQLEAWLTKVAARAGVGSEVMNELRELNRRMGSYTQDSPLAKEQIARFYQEWFESIESVPPAGRAVALYQDLSAAFVAGRQLAIPLPKSESPGKHPEQVAQQLMLSCI